MHVNTDFSGGSSDPVARHVSFAQITRLNIPENGYWLKGWQVLILVAYFNIAVIMRYVLYLRTSLPQPYT